MTGSNSETAFASIPLSLWCILNTPSYLSKIYKCPLIFVLFLAPPTLTMKHLRRNHARAVLDASERLSERMGREKKNKKKGRRKRDEHWQRLWLKHQKGNRKQAVMHTYRDMCTQTHEQKKTTDIYSQRGKTFTSAPFLIIICQVFHP